MEGGMQGDDVTKWKCQSRLGPEWGSRFGKELVLMRENSSTTDTNDAHTKGLSRQELSNHESRPSMLFRSMAYSNSISAVLPLCS